MHEDERREDEVPDDVHGLDPHLERLGLGGAAVARRADRRAPPRARGAAGEHDRPDRRDQQQEGGRLRRPAREQQLADLLAGLPKPAPTAFDVERVEPARDEGDAELDAERRGEQRPERA